MPSQNIAGIIPLLSIRMTLMINQPHNQSTATNPVGRFMVAVGAVIENTKTGRILIIQRASSQDWRGGEWEIDYGRIDQHEDPIDGLKREIKEEVGLTDLTIKEVMRVWHLYRGPVSAENDLIGITYYCTTETDDVKLSDEHIAYEWTTPEMALQRIKVDGIREDIQRFIQLKKMKETHFY